MATAFWLVLRVFHDSVGHAFEARCHGAEPAIADLVLVLANLVLVLANHRVTPVGEIVPEDSKVIIGADNIFHDKVKVLYGRYEVFYDGKKVFYGRYKVFHDEKDVFYNEKNV